MIKYNLSDTKVLGCNLNQLVFLNIFEHLFEAHDSLWYNTGFVI
mgnify:CR=1 FL=1